MKSRTTWNRCSGGFWAVVTAVVLLSGCSNDGGGNSPGPAPTYTVGLQAEPAEGGTVAGAGDFDSGADATIEATANTGYRFVNWTENGTEVSSQASYTFTVSAHRSLNANFEPASYSVGGTVTGLTGAGLILQNSGGDDLSITSDGPFTFATALPDGTAYDISVLAQPSGQLCTVNNRAGKVNGADISDITVVCGQTYTVGGTVTGLAGSGLVLRNNGGDDLTIGGNGEFSFPTPLADGSAYSVSVLNHPTNFSQSCTVINGSGKLSGADVSNITISCTTNSYSIGGTVSGLESSGLVLQNNGGDDLPVNGSGNFIFATAIADGSAYSVEILTQPANQHCAVTNGIGTVSGAHVDTVTINCEPTYTVTARVSGLAGTGLVLQNSGGDDLPIPGNGDFVFQTRLTDGSSYSVDVLLQPTDLSQTCEAPNGTGNVGGANVIVDIACSTNTYTVGGSVTGLNGSLTLQNNDADDLPLTADSQFTFATALEDGTPYGVSVLSDPPGQRCTVTNGSGTLNGADVTNVGVECVNVFTVSTAAGQNGEINPTSAVVEAGGTTTLNLNAFAGFHFGEVSGCGGSFDPATGTYTTGPITADCTVESSFVGGVWTWLGGSDTPNAPGVYGTQGLWEPGNMPGARLGAAAWTDAEGNVWLFGGLGLDAAGSIGFLGDLWKYTLATGEWVWMGGSDTPSVPGVYGVKGTPADANTPGSRVDFASWIDAGGRFWLFGGVGFDAEGLLGHLNDLWMYDPAAGQWTWVGGTSIANPDPVYGTLGQSTPENIPGGLARAGSWTDQNGNVWLFGGEGFGKPGVVGRLNNLWRYDPASNQWAWMGGPGASQPSAPAVYGTQGVADLANIPGARQEPTSWTGAGGNLWLFGGDGYDSAGAPGYLNDLWKYNPTSGQWTWMGGANTVGAAGVYGSQGVSDPANIPAARAASVAWRDDLGNLWLFGGLDQNSTGATRFINDLWKYNPTSGEWVWMAGSKTFDASGVYGTPGLPAAGNVPGARARSPGWKDSVGNILFFGGDNNGLLNNDLWRFDVPR